MTQEKSKLANKISLTKIQLESSRIRENELSVEIGHFKIVHSDLKTKVKQANEKLHALKIATDKQKSNLHIGELELAHLEKQIQRETSSVSLSQSEISAIVNETKYVEKELERFNQNLKVGRKKKLMLEARSEKEKISMHQLQQEKDTLLDTQDKWAAMNRIRRPVEIHPWRYLKYVNPDEFEKVQIALEMRFKMRRPGTTFSSIKTACSNPHTLPMRAQTS